MNRYFNLIRKMIFSEGIKEAKAEIEEYELYFWAKRIRGKSHVSGIEKTFEALQSARLAKFNEYSSKSFIYHLKECE